MGRTKRTLGLAGIACLAVFALWMVEAACACAPTEYVEVAPADLPARVREVAGRDRPGLVPERAWVYGVGLSGPGRTVFGHLVRGKVPGDWWRRDVKVPFVREPSPPDQLDLRPIP